MNVQGIGLSQIQSDAAAKASGSAVTAPASSAIDKNGNMTYFYIQNSRGDVIKLLNENGDIIRDYEYAPFGKEADVKTEGYGADYFTAKWQQEVEDNAIDNPFRFGGEYKDEESGNYYLRARYYDPELQRFTQEDTYKGNYNDPMSLNGYAFCSQNPVNRIDPSGHKDAPAGATKTKTATQKTTTTTTTKSTAKSTPAPKSKSTSSTTTKSSGSGGSGGSGNNGKANETKAKAEVAANESGKAYTAQAKAYEQKTGTTVAGKVVYNSTLSKFDANPLANMPAISRPDGDFGPRTPPTTGASSKHNGVDFGIPDNTKVQSVLYGKVICVSQSKKRGNYVQVESYFQDQTVTILYQHLSSANVSVGQYVAPGQNIALSGHTGIGTGPHLHFEIQVNGDYVNPEPYFNR